jgi:hypothetical protein
LQITEREFVHGALVRVTGRNGRQAVVETGWRLQTTGPAELVTVYPAATNVGAEVEPVIGRVPPLDITGATWCAAIYAFADSAGQRAGSALKPTPMVLEEWGTRWEGACGFAWVHLPNARKPFAKWLLEQGLGYRAHPGVDMFSKLSTQSIELHQAYVHAFAEVLRINDIGCVVDSRLD